MSLAQALAIAAAGLMLAGNPWGGKLAYAEAQAAAVMERAEILAEHALIEASNGFVPDGDCIKRTYAAL